MSIQIMTLVWQLDLSDSEKLTLLALADNANDEGVCWPSMATLAKKCSKADRTVQRSIKALEAKGHLSREERPGKGMLYHIHPRHSDTPDAPSPPTPCRLTPDTVSDKPSRNINIPQTPVATCDDRDIGDEPWRIPKGRSWKETGAMLRELERKPKRQRPQRTRIPNRPQSPATLEPKVPVPESRQEDERSLALRNALRRALGQQIFGQWFATAALLVDQCEIAIIATSDFQAGWIEREYERRVASEAFALFGDQAGRVKCYTTGSKRTPHMPAKEGECDELPV